MEIALCLVKLGISEEVDVYLWGRRIQPQGLEASSGDMEALATEDIGEPEQERGQNKVSTV